MPIVTRAAKGSELTHDELDGNFTHLESELAGKSPTAHVHPYDPIGTATAAVAAHELLADPHPQYMTAAESALAFDTLGAGTVAAAAAVAAHELLADPHPQYMTSAESAAAFAALGHTHAFADVTDKPLTYPPDAHIAHDHIALTPQTDPGHGEAHVWYDSDRHALSYKTDIPNTSMQIGFENWVRVRNSSGVTISDGTVVVISGAAGQLPTIVPAIATTDDASQVLGMVTADIANNGQGYVTVFGEVNGLNTSAYADGAVLYLSATVAGALTDTPPTDPNHTVAVARVLYSHLTQGRLLVSVRDAEVYAQLVHTHPYEPAGAVAAHEAAGDPHPQYLTPSEADLAYAALSHGTHVPSGGADGEVLTKVAGAPAWAAPAGGGGGGLTLVSEVVVSTPVAQIDFTGLDSAKMYRLMVLKVTPAATGSSNSKIIMLSGTTPVTVSYGTTGVYGNNNAQLNNFAHTGAEECMPNYNGNHLGWTCDATITFHSGRMYVRGLSISEWVGAQTIVNAFFASAASNGLRLTLNTQNIVSGTVRLYEVA